MDMKTLYSAINPIQPHCFYIHFEIESRAPTLSGKSPRGRYLGRYNMVTLISMPASGFYKRPRSSVPTKEGSLLAKYAEKYAIRVIGVYSFPVVSGYYYLYRIGVN